jgi:SAM-dependent methyltransferase
MGCRPGSAYGSSMIRSLMTNRLPEAPNADQIRHWNETAGPRWVAQYDAIAGQIRGIGREALDRAALAPGSRVLDVGCGGGETTIEIARQVGPGGVATGLDVSQPMLTYALEKARAEGAGNASFTLADAQTAALPEGFYDLFFSRFGVMFFDDPAAALRNLRRALRPGGRFTFLCWRALDENPTFHVPARAVAKFVPLPPVVPHAPGPFAFADAERVGGFLGQAGFTEVRFEKLDRLLPVGGGSGLEEAAAFLIQMGPAAAALQGALPEVVSAARAGVREAIAPYQTDEGLRMPSATWIVTGGVAG